LVTAGWIVVVKAVFVIEFDEQYFAILNDDSRRTDSD
tara:strand:+ start:688 stop:798 length:111 start_codon:yes stop_codon:yes gene_type:complete